jgi:hypothetical protein
MPAADRPLKVHVARLRVIALAHPAKVDRILPPTFGFIQSPTMR